MPTTKPTAAEEGCAGCGCLTFGVLLRVASVALVVFVVVIVLRLMNVIP